MAPVDDKQPLGPDEWHACVEALEALIEHPESAPPKDRERVERLVARLYRKVRRVRRKADEHRRRDDDRATVERTARVRGTLGPPLETVEPIDLATSDGLLKAKSRRCYICKGSYRQVDSRYHLLCPPCARLNEEKRRQRADLRGRRAVVTGGRVKIGYQVALKLLRDGADVLVTTRFPTDAALRYAREPDFDAWGDRLRIEPLDFRAPATVLAFAERLSAEHPALDILINNAAQTVRQTSDHTAAAEALERIPLESLPANVRRLLGVRSRSGLPQGRGPLGLSGSIDVEGLEAGGLPGLPAPFEDPTDRRESNSWTARLTDVEPAELVEVLLVNTAAPFLLLGHLKPLFLRSPHADRYVVNVAGLDGQFGRRFKTDRHPHVNMSKAALNMITRTSAADYARDGIYMNSVDAGWVTHEGAYSTRVRMRARGFVPPLDEVDGAARIYDPIARGVGGERDFGLFLKDYRPTEW